MDPVTHFEMPALDRKRVSQFYSKTFGWQMNQMGPEMGNYITAYTTETDKDRMVQTPGHINGGFYEPTAETGRAPNVVIEVKDLKASIKAVAKNGGKVLGEPQSIPGVGTWVAFQDTEGTRVGMIQPADRSPPPKKTR